MPPSQCGSEAPASSFTRDTKLNHGFQAKSGRSSAEGVTRYGRSLCHKTRLLSSVRIRRTTGAPERHSARSAGRTEDTCSRNSCGCGGIGRRPGFRYQCREACRFNSCHPYQVCLVDLMEPFRDIGPPRVVATLERCPHHPYVRLLWGFVLVGGNSLPCSGTQSLVKRPPVSPCES